MSLCFTIRNEQSPGLVGLREGFPYVEVEPEYYEVLSPSFKAIHRETGKLIDLYDWKEFKGNELDVVAREFDAKKTEVEAMTRPVVVDLGQQHNPDGTKVDLIYRLSPSDIALKLQKSLELIGIARAEAKVFVCKGD
jgi:hypothetical protein